MTILAFWPAGIVENIPERHTYDNEAHIDAFKKLWENRNIWNVRFYDMESHASNDAYGFQKYFCNADDFEEDYNHEDLDGGHWCKALLVRSDEVRTIISIEG